MIRRAIPEDVGKIQELLSQIDLIHHEGRPDLFKIGTKYTDSEIVSIMSDEDRPVFVYVDDDGVVLGYCFCEIEVTEEDNIRPYMKTLYIDDLCVDEKLRGKHIGRELYDAAVKLAKDSGCYNLTLNVWSCNTSALRFYESCGLVPQKVGMELIL